MLDEVAAGMLVDRVSSMDTLSRERPRRVVLLNLHTEASFPREVLGRLVVDLKAGRKGSIG